MHKNRPSHLMVFYVNLKNIDKTDTREIVNKFITIENLGQNVMSGERSDVINNFGSKSFHGAHSKIRGTVYISVICGYKSL